jgi:glycerophosphoryl diester phosphodiesterase
MSFTFLENFKRPLIFAHRGYSAKAPENTRSAFKLAWKSGVPGVELDIRLCDSDEVVVFHDEELIRTTGHEGLVETSSLETLKTYDAGGYFDDRFKGEQIPLLSEVFDSAPAGTYFDIELKISNRNGRELSLALAKLIAQHNMEDRCIISSFYPSAIREIKIAAPKIPIAFIYSQSLAKEHPIQNFLARRISDTPILKPEWPLTKSALRHRRAVISWTVNDSEEARRCLDLGAVGIVSDDPSPLLSLG